MIDNNNHMIVNNHHQVIKAKLQVLYQTIRRLVPRILHLLPPPDRPVLNINKTYLLLMIMTTPPMGTMKVKARTKTMMKIKKPLKKLSMRPTLAVKTRQKEIYVSSLITCAMFLEI